MEKKKTIAELLDGKRVDSNIEVGSVIYDPVSNTFLFEDESKAMHITLHEEVEAYVTASLTTSTKRPYRVWRAL